MDPTASTASPALTLHCIAEPDYAAWRAQQSGPVRAWLDAAGFKPERGRWLLLPDSQRGASHIFLGVAVKKNLVTQVVQFIRLGCFRLSHTCSP